MGIRFKDAVDIWYARQGQAWLEYMGHGPAIEPVPGADLSFYGEAVEEGLRLWQPKPIEDDREIRDFLSRYAESLAPTLVEFMSTYWFAELGGVIEPWAPELFAVLPGLVAARWTDRFVAWRPTEPGARGWIPLGTDGNSGLELVASTATGVVGIYDFERGRVREIGRDIAEVVSRLEVRTVMTTQ